MNDPCIAVEETSSPPPLPYPTLSSPLQLQMQLGKIPVDYNMPVAPGISGLNDASCLAPNATSASNRRRSLLMIAAYYGSIADMRFLIEMGAQVNAKAPDDEVMLRIIRILILLLTTIKY